MRVVAMATDCYPCSIIMEVDPSILLTRIAAKVNHTHGKHFDNDCYRLMRVDFQNNQLLM